MSWRLPGGEESMTSVEPSHLNASNQSRRIKSGVAAVRSKDCDKYLDPILYGETF